MKDQILTIEERRALYLEMLTEIDAFCRSYGIRYSLSSGTLIGALRHKGFIPWDDDLDIMMPLPDMLKFKKEFKSDNMRFCDAEICSGYELPFPRVESLKTYSKNHFGDGFGLSIDIYIVAGLPDNEENRKTYFEKGQKLYFIRKKYKKLNDFFMSRLPIRVMPFYGRILGKYSSFLLSNSNDYNSSTCFFRIASPMTDNLIRKNTLDFDLFEKLVEVDFEGKKFWATAHADKYLSQRYGDYMTPIPVEDRDKNHHGTFYWR